MRVERGALVAWLCAFWLSACGPSYGEAYVSSFRTAQRAYNAGRYAQAAQLFELAAGDAERVKDRDEAYFMQARMFRKLERWRDARDVYRHLIATSPTGPRTVRAVFEYAELEIEHGRPAEGWRLMKEGVLRYPNHGAARHALVQVAEHIAETKGEPALRTELEAWSKALAGSDAEQQLQYLVARSFERSGDLEQARGRLLATARAHPYPHGSLTDDALWRASQVAERMGKFELAVADLRELLSAREEATGGSYERPRFPEAQMRVAELYRDKLRDLAAARREFRAMYRTHNTSVLADDAMWNEALIAWRQGDGEAACDIGEELPERFPESRYRRCVSQLCPALAAKTRTKRECPRYIREQLGDAQ